MSLSRGSKATNILENLPPPTPAPGTAPDPPPLLLCPPSLESIVIQGIASSHVSEGVDRWGSARIGAICLGSGTFRILYNLETFSRVSKARLRHYMRPSCSIDLAREISAICRALIAMAIGAARAWSRCVFVVVHYICAFCICEITHFLLFEAYWACLCAILFSGREDGHMHE